MSDPAPTKTNSNNQSGGNGGGGGGRGNRWRGERGNGGRGRGGRGRNNKKPQAEPAKPDPEAVRCILIDEEKDEEDAPEHHFCMICYSACAHKERGIAPCGHDDVCASCHIRLRSLLSDKKCPICKAENQQIIVDADPDPEVNEHKNFEQYEKWGNDIGPNHTFRDDIGMFFPVEYYATKVTPLFSFRCGVHQCHFENDSSESNSPSTLKALQSHLATAHSPPLQICQLCITHKRDFISRLPRFTANQLKDHNKYGDIKVKGTAAGKANKGHPMCNFCQPRRFYDLTELHKHLNKEHYECFVCKKLEKPLQFFKDYNKLNLHFDREHFLCRFPECLAARFVVFSNEIDLKAHERDMHGVVTGGSTKIQMEFRVRSSGRDGSGVEYQQQDVPNMVEDFGFSLDGEVFVPESLEDTNDIQDNEPDISHGPHAERTALLREQARARREEMGITEDNPGGMTATEEAFPSLGGQTSNNMINWNREGGGSVIRNTRRNTTSLNNDNFPSLGAPARTTNAKTSKLRATRVGGANSSFAAMRSAASTSTSRPFANAATTQQPFFASSVNSRQTAPKLGADNFPSLGGGPKPSGGTNTYSAAKNYTKHSNSRGMNLNIDQHFPAPSLSLSNNSVNIPAKKKNILNKKPAAKPHVQTDNFLAFPPPSSTSLKNGNNQVEGMKQALGQATYKQLKKFTKAFGSNTLDPESYVTSVVSLFDDGVKDPILWEYIPNLISSCPNESRNKRALRYMESMRYSSGPNVATAASSSTSASVSSGWAPSAASRTAPPSLQYDTTARASTFASSAQKVSTGFTGRSLPISQAKVSNSWGSKKITSFKAGGTALATTAQAKKPASAPKKKMKQKSAVSTISKQNSKAKKNELRDLAFGRK